MQNFKKKLTAYIAPLGFTAELLNEISSKPIAQKKELILVEELPKVYAWAQNTWLNPIFIPIHSISDAVKKLSVLQRNWHLYPGDYYRRASLIQKQLPYVSKKKLHFGEPYIYPSLGSWTLWEHQTILASTHCSSVFPDGMVSFHENTVDPPSRAYLKLWELFTLLKIQPKPEEVCLDLGSAPGGWTWVLAKLGAHVISVDKAPLAPHIALLPNVDYKKISGFSIIPSTIDTVHWLFSDIACYPSRLYQLLQKWLDHPTCHTIVATIKLQGQPSSNDLNLFKKIPFSSLIHLSHNKHELTWVYSKKYSCMIHNA